jgi:hypothetical protein
VATSAWPEATSTQFWWARLWVDLRQFIDIMLLIVFYS